jgi:hypothetical protein
MEDLPRDSSSRLKPGASSLVSVNWGFRIWSRGMIEPTRPEICEEFGPWLNQLQYRGVGHKDGNDYKTFGICYVPNPYGPGRA